MLLKPSPVPYPGLPEQAGWLNSRAAETILFHECSPRDMFRNKESWMMAIVFYIQSHRPQKWVYLLQHKNNSGILSILMYAK